MDFWKKRMNENNIPKRYLEAAQKYADHIIGGNGIGVNAVHEACRVDFLAGAKVVHEEILLMKEWFNHIEQLATDKKTVNGFVMSDSDTFDEIRALAKRCQEYIETEGL